MTDSSPHIDSFDEGGQVTHSYEPHSEIRDDPQKALADLKGVLEGRIYSEGVGPQPWWEPFAILENLVEQNETLREFFDAFEEVEGGIVDFDLHNEAVMRMRLAREAVYAMRKL